MANLNAEDLKTYTAAQVASLADVDIYAVRDEGFRRQTAAEKKLARALKAVEAARHELAESATIITAAFDAKNSLAEWAA
jgi:hypothetical protein